MATPVVQQPVRDLETEAELQKQAGGLLKQLLQRAGELIQYLPDNPSAIPVVPVAETPSAYGNYVPVKTY